MLKKGNTSILILSIILGIFLLGLVSTCEPVCGDVGIKYSYDNSYGTGIAIREDGVWIPETPAELTKGRDHEIKYYIRNNIPDTTNNIHVMVKIDNNTLSEYDTSINKYHYKIVDLDISQLECDSHHIISVEVEIINEIDCNLDDNYAEREIIVRCEPPEPICGNGVIEEGEECEIDGDCSDCNPNTTDTCVNCMCVYVPEPYCGDGNLDAGEECDDGINNGEVCVPEYGDSCQYCGNTCEFVVLEGPYCGDCECDGGYYETCETCPQDCGECPPEPPVCGNGILESSEECDLGELLNGQVCEPPYDGSCTYCSEECEEITLYDGYCGDGIKDILYEECDDGNSINGDGCSASCIIEEEDNDRNGGGRKRSFKLQQFCDVNWVCSGWNECDNGITTRRCIDTNRCDYSYNEPIEQTGCEVVAKALIEEKGFNWILFGIIIALILIVILIILLPKR